MDNTNWKGLVRPWENNIKNNTFPCKITIYDKFAYTLNVKENLSRNTEEVSSRRAASRIKYNKTVLIPFITGNIIGQPPNLDLGWLLLSEWIQYMGYSNSVDTMTKQIFSCLK